MARIAEEGLLERIVDAATAVFIRHGYRGCRVEQIAERAGVSVGTVYRYVDGKEALFELAIRNAFESFDPAAVATPFRGTPNLDQIAELWNRLLGTHPVARLEAALEAEPPADPAIEFPEIVRDLYRWERRYWKAILLIERCASRDWPELDLLFYKQFRRRSLELGAEYIRIGIARGGVGDVPDPHLAARLVGECVAFFALHRHTAPDSADMDETLVEETVVTMLTRAVLTAQPTHAEHHR